MAIKLENTHFWRIEVENSMKPVSFPLHQQMKEESVRYLQKHLRTLLFFGDGFHLSRDESLKYDRELRSELADSTYGQVTEKLISLFQNQNHLEINGMVDETTANAINAFLRKRGAFRLGTAKILNLALRNLDEFERIQKRDDLPAVHPTQLLPEKEMPSMSKNRRSTDLDMMRIRYAFWMAVIGLSLSITLAVFLYLNGMSGSTELVAVVGVFTGVTGTLVGMFFGVQVGSAGKEQERSEREKADLMTRMAFAMMSEDQVKGAMDMFKAEVNSGDQK
jgi:hypothetical protein